MFNDAAAPLRFRYGDAYRTAPAASEEPVKRGGGDRGNSFVKVIAFGPTLRAASILNSGQSGDPASPHFFDQAKLCASGQWAIVGP